MCGCFIPATVGSLPDSKVNKASSGGKSAVALHSKVA